MNAYKLEHTYQEKTNNQISDVNQTTRYFAEYDAARRAASEYGCKYECGDANANAEVYFSDWIAYQYSGIFDGTIYSRIQVVIRSINLE